MQEHKEVPGSGVGCLVRFYWLFFGNALLFFILIFIVEKRARIPSFLDAAFWVAVGLLIVVRYVDIRYLNGQTGEGKPATMDHWRRYAAIVVPAALVAWILAHVFGRVMG